MPEPAGFDPAPFRRSALLREVLAQLRGENPDAGLSAEEAALRREVRTILIERHNALEGLGPEAADRLIRWTVRRVQRTARRKARRFARGKTWGERP